MAQTTTYLGQEDMKALEQSRRLVSQLANNIASLRADVLRSNPLPPWSSLQNTAAILGKNLETLTSHLAKHSELFNKTVIYPSTNYPGRTQEGVLESILRKKLEPPVASWVDEGREMASNLDTSPAQEKEAEEFWDWTRQWIGTRVAKYVMEEQGDNYTGEERETGVENVNTGLKRKLDEDEDDESEDEDEDEEMEDVMGTSAGKMGTAPMDFGMGEVKKDPNGKSRSAEDVWRFATIGMVPEPSMGRR